jgi:hypothetical protein
MGLSKDELTELKSRLEPSNICTLQFFEDGKMCPNTTALAIKEGKEKFSGKQEVKDLLRRHGITKVELWIFLFLYDLPALISQRYFKESVRDFKSVIDKMILEP